MKSKLSKLMALALVLCMLFAACGKQGQDNGGIGGNGGNGGIGGSGDNNTVATVNELSAENGVSASGTFEAGSALKAEPLAADGEQGMAALSAIDKPYDSAKVAVFDITLTKGGEKVQPGGKVRITMLKPFEADNYVTYHIGDSGAEELATAVNGDKISFETTGFSCFVITTNKVVHRTKLNYKGVWYQSLQGEPVDETYHFQNDPYMIDKAGDAFTIADAVHEDTTLKLCYNPDNFKYDARARDNVGYLIGRGGEDWEFRAELRVGSPNGPAIAKWHGYEIYGYYRYETYDDGKEVAWTESHFLNFIGEVHPKLEYIQFVSVKNVDGYTDENGGWISEKDALDVYVVRTVIGTSHRLNRELMASRYGVPKISEKAVNTRISSYAGYPRYWWFFDIDEGKPTHWLLINGNVRATVFNGRGELVNSASSMRMDFDYDENLDMGFSESKCNRYYILLEENGVEKPDCKMDLQFLENP